MKVRIRITPPAVFEDVEVDVINQTTLEYAADVANERFYDNLNSGDAIEELYKNAAFSIERIWD